MRSIICGLLLVAVTLLLGHAGDCRADDQEAVRLFKQGTAAVEHHAWDRAITAFTEAIRLKPDYAEAYSKRGAAYGMKSEREKELADCNKAIEHKPDYAEAYANRGIYYADQGEWEKSVADFTVAFRLAPNDADIYRKRGIAYGCNKEWDKAIADFDS